MAAASFAIAVKLETKDPEEERAIEVMKALIAADAGSVAVILDVGLVRGVVAVNKPTPGGNPAATATVALATEIAA